MVNAISVTQDVLDWLHTAKTIRLLHQFPHVWNLIADNNTCIALVTESIGNGPFNIMLSLQTMPMLPAQVVISSSEHCLRIGAVSIDLQHAHKWNPTPTFDRHLPIADVITICEQALILPVPDSKFEQFAHQTLVANTQKLLNILEQGNMDELAIVTSIIAGHGFGLTPAGDDWLVGCMVALHLMGDSKCAAQIAAVAIPITTPLSAMWLRAGAVGKFDEAWHHLLCAKSVQQCQQATQTILNRGASSGKYALMGFIETAKHLMTA